MIIGKSLGRTALIWAFHCPQLLPTSQSFKRTPLSPTLHPWVPRIKDMAYCLPGVSLKQKQDAVKKIRVAGIRGGTKEEISAVPAMGNASEWGGGGGVVGGGGVGYELPKKSGARHVLKHEAQIPYGKQSLSFLASADLPQPHLPPCESLYSLCNGTNGSSPNRASCFSPWITA